MIALAILGVSMFLCRLLTLVGRYWDFTVRV